jgi:hypothetical protein
LSNYSTAGSKAQYHQKNQDLIDVLCHVSRF